MTPIPPSYEALEREVMDLRKRVEQPNQLAGAGLCFMLPGSVTNHSHMRDAMSSAEEPWVASFRQRLEASGMSPERVDELVGWGQGIVEASRHRSLPEMVEIRKRLDKLEREAEARSRTAHYPAARPLREPTYRTLGRKTADDSGVELD